MATRVTPYTGKVISEAGRDYEGTQGYYTPEGQSLWKQPFSGEDPEIYFYMDLTKPRGGGYGTGEGGQESPYELSSTPTAPYAPPARGAELYQPPHIKSTGAPVTIDQRWSDQVEKKTGASTWSVWGNEDVNRDNMYQLGAQLGLTEDQVFEAAKSAAVDHKNAHNSGYTRGSSPLHIQDAVARKMFATAGREYQPIYTPEQLAQSGQMAIDRDKDSSFSDNVMEFIKVPLIFASLILTAGTISSAIGGTVAGGTAAGAGAAGIGDLTGGAGMGWGAASGAGTTLGGGATLTATGTAGPGAEYLSGEGFGDLAMQGGGEVFNTEALRGLSAIDVGKIVKTVKGVIDRATMDETGSRYAANTVDNNADSEEDPTDVIENLFEFFNGKLPFNERGGGLLRLSTGERVFDSASKFGRGIINTSRS